MTIKPTGGRAQLFKPHHFVHDFKPGRYLAVQASHGHHMLFLIKENVHPEDAFAEARRRGFKPLYTVNTHNASGSTIAERMEYRRLNDYSMSRKGWGPKPPKCDISIQDQEYYARIQQEYYERTYGATPFNSDQGVRNA